MNIDSSQGFTNLTARRADVYALAAQIGRYFVLAVLLLAIVAAIFAPIAARNWSKNPFPGFLVEQSLVITDISGEGWTGLGSGLNYPMKITQINNYFIRTPADYQRFFSNATVGRVVSIYTLQPDGEAQVFSSVKIITFPKQDILRLFWLPYGIGLIYLFLGLWVYARRGKTGAGRAFTYATASAAIVNMLIFNVWTSHQGTLLWTFAIAQLGGAMIVLAFLLPEQIPSLSGRIWIRILAYGLSAILAAWGIISVLDSNNPWAYVTPWRFSYYYVGIGLVIFVLSMVIRLRTNLTPISRQQVRIILVGSLLAFTPIGIWLAIQSILEVPFNPLYFLPLLLFFPLSIAVAMVRFRLWDFDLVVRRTIIYTILTILLVMIYLLLVIVLDRLFDRYLGESNLFNVIATIVIVLIFTPLRKLVQRVIDRRLYRNRIKAEKRIQAFAERLRSQMELEQLSDDLIQVTRQTVHPSSISLWIPKTTYPNGGENV